MVLREQALDSEDLLKRAIRKFSRYVARLLGMRLLLKDRLFSMR